MAFAAVTYVNLEGLDQAQAEKLLRGEVIPMTKSLPGFQVARFLRSTDGKTGVGAVIFDNEANAKQSLEAPERPAQAPPIRSTELYEVLAEI
jgi:hypothetical protein